MAVHGAQAKSDLRARCEQIPKEWVETLTEGKRIGKILASLPVTATDKAEL